MRLALPGRELDCVTGRPLLMGIVNTGPDSFSDARRLDTLEAQVEEAMAQVAAGASIIDVGGESGVTYTGPTAEEVEIERVVPLVAALAPRGVVVSVDTFKPAVAAAAVAAGASIVNDVSGLADERLAELCAATGAALVLMHTRAAPKQEDFPGYDDVAGDVRAFLGEAIGRALACGCRPDQLILDPGPDFAKRPSESVLVLRDLGALRALDRPVLAAVSRKYFLGAVTGRPPDRRLGASVAAAVWAARAGASILRVHDVAEVADALAVTRVLDGLDEVPAVDARDDALKWIRGASDATSG
jgi:dihydropteroate synthase